MTSIKKVAPITALLSALALGGCTYDDYGYGGVNVGYGTGYYYDDYAYGPYAPYGWYDGYYYPGSGYWLYDRGGVRHRWSDRQRYYWEQRRQNGRWDGPATRPWRPDMRDDRRWSGRDRRPDGDRSWRGRTDGAAVQPIPRGAEVQRVPENRVRTPDAASRNDGLWSGARERRRRD